MSLKNLLPIGRSFAATASRSGRFRSSPPAPLPPPAAARGVTPGPGPGPELAVAESTRGTAGVGMVGVGVKLPGAGGAKRRSVAKVSGRRLPGWLEQFLLAVFRPGNRRRSTRTEQTELCFQTVKVARNDLAMSDVEVVVKAPERPALSPDCRARVLRLWWDHGTSRLRRWGQNLF